MIEVKEFYKVSEIADFFGVSSDVIRFYDKMGILSPGKNKANNYRAYTWSDFICMDYIFRLKKMDLPLSSIRQIINEFSIEDSLDLMKEQEKEIDKKIEQLVYARKLAREHISLFATMEKNDGLMEVIESPIFICRIIDGPLQGILDDFQRLTNAQMPYLTFILNKEATCLTDVDKDASYEEYKRKVVKPSKQYISIIDDGTLAESKLVQENEKMTIFKPRLCLHAMETVKLGETLKHMYQMHEWREAQGYQVCGNMLTRMLTLANGGETEFTYYDMWIPVEPKL
ncbi:DNA-binding transcriptional MerR regulator [Clostridiales Family XIII bacterium PM5-7]